MISPERLVEKVNHYGGFRPLILAETIPEVTNDNIEGAMIALNKQKNPDDFDAIARSVADTLYQKGLRVDQ